MAFAGASALQAGIERERILNFMSREQLLKWVRGVRERSSKFKRKGSAYGQEENSVSVLD